MLRTPLLVSALLLALSACSNTDPTPAAQAPAQPAAATPPQVTQPETPAPAAVTAPQPASPQAVTQQVAPTPAKGPDPKAVAAAAQAALTKSTASYATLREQLLKMGWRPTNEGQCTANVKRPQAAELCAAIPELNSCSAEGDCRLLFQREGSLGVQSLTVMTHGPIEEWNTADNTRLQIRGIMSSPPPLKRPTP